MAKLRDMEHKNIEESKLMMDPCIRIEEFACEPNSTNLLISDGIIDATVMPRDISELRNVRFETT